MKRRCYKSEKTGKELVLVRTGFYPHTCNETPLSLVGIPPALEQLNKPVKANHLQVAAAVEKALGQRTRHAHYHGRSTSPEPVGPPLRVLAMGDGRHGVRRAKRWSELGGGLLL